jgi:hypothetical protein
MRHIERMDCHRAIVRAAMKAEGFEFIGVFNDVDDEEYGDYLYKCEDDDSLLMLCNLNEDSGGIETGSLEDFTHDNHEYLEHIKTLLNYEGDDFSEKIRNRYPLGVPVFDPDGRVSDLLYEYREDKIRDILDCSSSWLTDAEWNSLLHEWSDDAVAQIKDEDE